MGVQPYCAAACARGMGDDGYVSQGRSTKGTAMSTIKHTILVASGKGGVGKSTVAANLALALVELGFNVGLLDADVYGPSIPTMFGDAPKPGSPDGKRIYAVEQWGLKLMSMGYLMESDTAVVWRGPMLAGAVMQFVNDVEWGELDFLVFDLPPGTGDIQLSIAQKLKVSGAVLVTTPQEVALADVVRAKSMFDRVRIPTLGIVENMSYFICDGCEMRHEIFASGGGRRLAESMGVPLLGEIPLEPAIRVGGDTGAPLFRQAPTSQSAGAFRAVGQAVAEKAEAMLAAKEAAEGPKKRLRIVQ